MLVGSYMFPKADGIVFGKPWAEAIAEHVERLGKRRVLAVVSGSLAAAQPLEAGLRQALGDRLIGLTSGVRAHSPREDVATIAVKARDLAADLLLAIGGGSVIDAAKVAQLCLATGALTVDAFDAIQGQGRAVHAMELPVRVLAVPSTLSGAEFTSFAGVSDTARHLKQMYYHEQMTPQVVVLDPRVTVDTPAELWLSTGIRAVDHAVEDICSINSQPLADAASAQALQLLGGALPRNRAQPADLDARLEAMIGVWLSMVGTQGGVEKGVSHAIGHVLGGSFGVPHGITSCITLPHVLRWNKPVDTGRQAMVAAALGRAGDDAGDVVADLIIGLGLPHTLQAMGIKREDLPRVAELTMGDPWTPTNPRRIDGPSDIMAILEQAW
ncbi:iron-containing alcohol dehydrogenase [Chelatococcus reniformis]|uniref:Maleylacetate reductase n=1 Tax=Chelatococcus reniformis TaxID=1494448 RepID=A0A916U3P9_9HYPH|nr:iron-containing alcohol dehydrogenase [Chelatococcus reniformis]GGC57691.1 maleylacetate reductase [Chelatococcus reniformis]